MNEPEFQSKLAELMGEISTLPATERQKLEKLASETRQRHERLKQTVNSLQESLDYFSEDGVPLLVIRAPLHAPQIECSLQRQSQRQFHSFRPGVPSADVILRRGEVSAPRTAVAE